MTIRKLIESAPDPVRAVGARLCSPTDGDAQLCFRLWFEAALAASEAAYAAHLSARRSIETLARELTPRQLAIVTADRAAIDEKTPALLAALRRFGDALWTERTSHPMVVEAAKEVMDLPLPWEVAGSAFGLRALVALIHAVLSRREPLHNHQWMAHDAIHYAGQPDAARAGMLAGLDRFMAVRTTHPAWAHG